MVLILCIMCYFDFACWNHITSIVTLYLFFFLTRLPCSGFSSLQGLILMKVFAMNRSCLCNQSKWGMILHVDIPIISENVEDLHD